MNTNAKSKKKNLNKKYYGKKFRRKARQVFEIKNSTQLQIIDIWIVAFCLVNEQYDNMIFV